MMVSAGNYSSHTMKRKLNSWSVMLGLLAGLVFTSSAGSTLTQKHDNISNQFRVRRVGFFMQRLRNVPRPARMLDLGGTIKFWTQHPIPEALDITVLNIFSQAPTAGLTAVVGDACDLSQYPDQHFDVIFSNSVLGHVGDFERQKQMAREIRRVGKRYFVQTPNQDFPVDWRTLVPFFHWLSPETQAWWFQRVPVGRYDRIKDPAHALQIATHVRNVTRAELAELFPEATIEEERVGGFTKSFIVHYGFD
jgi:SAM-dependent methyltransferase